MTQSKNVNFENKTERLANSLTKNCSQNSSQSSDGLSFENEDNLSKLEEKNKGKFENKSLIDIYENILQKIKIQNKKKMEIIETKHLFVKKMIQTKTENQKIRKIQEETNFNSSIQELNSSNLSEKLTTEVSFAQTFPNQGLIHCYKKIQLLKIMIKKIYSQISEENIVTKQLEMTQKENRNIAVMLKENVV